MKSDFIDDAIDNILGMPIIEADRIPDIDLYMDQVTTLVEEKLSKTKRLPQDKLLTKTMINNYTKAGLIEPPVKKKYTKEHILRLIMIYHLKSVLSISDIKSLFGHIEDDRAIYERFIELQKKENLFFKDNTKRIKELPEAEDKTQRAVEAVLLLAVAAQAYKQMAEYIIDNNFNTEDKKQPTEEAKKS